MSGETFTPGVCTPRALPPHLVIPAAMAAQAINPANAPSRAPWAPRLEPSHLALLTSAYWPSSGVKLTVGFMEPIPADLADRLLSHMAAWGKTANVEFVRTKTDPMVRVTREGDGYWSYLGTGILSIPKGEPTMCLQGFTMRMPDSEFYRVVRHESGHTLSFVHEHMRPELVALLDEARTIAYFARTQGWSEQTTREQVLTPLDPRSIRGTAPDQMSIMTYQLSGECTKSGLPIAGGTDIDASDYAFAAKMYPKGIRPLTPDDIADRLAGVF